MIKGLIYLATRAIFKALNSEFSAPKCLKIDPRAFVGRGGRVIFGENCVIRAGAMLLPSGGHIKIGKNTTLNQYSIINGFGGVEIGDNVMIASMVGIYSSNHGYAEIGCPMRDQPLSTKGGVTIEDDVWIGTHAVILDGVTIGSGAIVSAGAVVTRSVASNDIVAGVPARSIGTRAQQSQIDQNLSNDCK